MSEREQAKKIIDQPDPEKHETITIEELAAELGVEL